MKNELRITFDSNDNCEVEIHGLSGKTYNGYQRINHQR